MNDRRRFALIALAIVLSFAGLFAGEYRSKCFAILAALQTFASGWLAVRNKEEPPRYNHRDHHYTKSFRKLLAKDSETAILLLQIAVLTQSISVLLPDKPHPKKPEACFAAEASRALPKDELTNCGKPTS